MYITSAFKVAALLGWIIFVRICEVGFETIDAMRELGKK